MANSGRGDAEASPSTSGPTGFSLYRNSISTQTLADFKFMTERAAALSSRKAQPIRVRSDPVLGAAEGKVSTSMAGLQSGEQVR